MAEQPDTADIESTPRYNDSLLAARDVTTGYGDLRIVNEVDLDVKDNEIVMIFGPNGAGKSTFMKVLCGLLPLWSGSLMLGERDLSTVEVDTMASQGISYVPQNNNIFDNLTVVENLEIGGIESRNSDERMATVFELFPELEEFRNTKVNSLSGGQRQMVAMGRALMPKPDILLIDEPSAGLAPQLVERSFNHVKRIRDEGTAILLIEQNVRAGLEIADRGYVFQGGENRFEGDTEYLLGNGKIQELYMGH